jgi:hypothetical protein
MDKTQILAFQLIQTLVQSILSIEEERDEQIEDLINEAVKELAEEERFVSTSEKVNKVKLPKNWNKVNGEKF